MPKAKYRLIGKKPHALPDGKELKVGETIELTTEEAAKFANRVEKILPPEKASKPTKK